MNTITTPTVRIGLPALPTPVELEQTDPDELRDMVATDLALSNYFAARATVVTTFLGRARTGVPAPPVSAALDVREVMQRTGMSRGWLYRQARAGKLPFAQRHGRAVRFDAAGLNRWLARRPR